MGLDCEAITIIGYKIEKEKLYEEKEIITRNTCACKVDKKGNYCPECGKKMEIYNVEIEPIDDYDHRRDEYFDYKVYDRSGETDDYVYICIKYMESGSNRCGGSKNVSKIDLNLELLKSEIETFKEKIELIESWDEERFGIYNLLHMGY